MTRQAAARRLLFVAVTIVAASLPAVAADIERQRTLFVDVYPTVERGDWSAVEALAPADRRLLTKYILWPDLRAAFFRANLDEAGRDDVEAFLQRHETLKPVRELRYRYALKLAERGDHAAFLELYVTFYQGMGNAKLDCHALAAEIGLGRGETIVDRGIGLWMTGRSQDDACDPAFRYLEEEGHLQTRHYVERFELAIGIRAFSRARWLARSIDENTLVMAERWLRAQNDPTGLLEQAGDVPQDKVGAEQLAYAVERLTYDDPVAARKHWLRLRQQRDFDTELIAATERHIALWMARDSLPGARALLAALPQAAADAEVMRWRARSSLRAGHWRELLEDIASMPPAERTTEEWRFWQAVALRKTDRPGPGNAILRELATERSYYGFLAADELGVDYTLDESAITADDAVLAELSAREDLVRARELFYVGLDGRGRSEWDSAVAPLSRDRQLQAARLANLWGWHSRAIATAARAADYDDLSIRYPLPYLDAFSTHSEAASIPPTWAYGVARSESLFMRDVRSGAGAVGLMQLMPTTGRQVARRISLPWSGLATLTDPDGNIRLGTTYLGEMATRYAGNRVLATAAYNAGPLRVDEWLPETPVDTRVWIETIPFNETRRYVRRVLAAEAIFHWRMTGELRRLSDALPTIVAPPEKVAKN